MDRIRDKEDEAATRPDEGAARTDEAVAREEAREDGTDAREDSWEGAEEEAGDDGQQERLPTQEEVFLYKAALEREIGELREEDPSFDLGAAMKMPAFRALVEAGEPLRRAHEYVNADRLKERAREEARMEMMQNIRARGGRPAALRTQGGFAGADVAKLSEAALRRIDERLKRGERVRL